MSHRFLKFANGMLEMAVSRRALALMFLLLSALLTISGWLRPPLSRDLTPLQLPLGIWKGLTDVPDAATAHAAGTRIVSPGMVELAAICVGIAIVAWRPKSAAPVIAGLFSLSLGAYAIVLLNHPLLVESLARELGSRQHLATMIAELNESSVSVIGQARVPVLPLEDRSPLWSAWPFRCYGTFLVLQTAIGLLLFLRGTLPRRLGVVALFAVLGIILGAAVCSQRLLAESFWWRAQELERSGRPSAARVCLARSVWIMPDLGHLGRTWLLAGRIDADQGLAGDAARFLQTDRLAHAAEWHAALDHSRALLQTADNSLAVRRQAAQLYVMAGLGDYRLGQLTAAHDAWRRSHDLDPARLDSVCYLGLLQAKLNRTHPEEAASWLNLALPRLADRLLRADILSSLGDAYFEAGQFAESRAYYRDSLRVYDLPKEINYRGRKGLLGM